MEKLGQERRLIAQCKKILGSAAVLCQAQQISAYITSHDRRLPLAVLLPQRYEQIQALMKLARDYGYRVIARGSGSRLQQVAAGRTLVLSLSRLRQIRDIDAAAQTLSVDAGASITHINNRLQRSRLHLPWQPLFYAPGSIGGSIAERAALRYRQPLDWLSQIRELTWVSVDGELQHWQASGLEVNGVDWLPLLTAGLGVSFADSFGIIVSAQLGLQAKPHSRLSFIASFASVREALETQDRLQQSALPVSMELLLSPGNFSWRDFLPLPLQLRDANAILLLDCPAAVWNQDERLAILQQALQNTHYLRLGDTDANAFWQSLACLPLRLRDLDLAIYSQPWRQHSLSRFLQTELEHPGNPLLLYHGWEQQLYKVGATMTAAAQSPAQYQPLLAALNV